ncbi:M16 family metallopeptidase [Noviherbaspirillum galbum]|uniref:Insulinase family protein n=1 Tax=Noviherbaspirillum galbum TaxID=2709383 RepID=A0A6B3SKH7_9BURK|nr:pitrilysin family protein [Noviherbaspirillum galbum]NEX61058.1 insulinase family protein [Noviherbaspirillum galbum]
MFRWWNRFAPLLALSIVLGFMPGPAAAQSLPRGITQVSSVEGITEYRLANGLKVLLYPDISKPTAVVNITYLVGSRQENYGETGMAHLLEHLLFKGTPRHANIPGDFNRRGMRFNGTTSLDRTNYFELFQASDDNLKWAIGMEADRMVNSFIAKKDLDSEMTVVRNEYELGENSPYNVLFKRLHSVAFDWHNYGNATIGNRSDIENVRIENLQAFYRTYYQPDNAVLLVAGRFEPARALKWINEAFGAIPAPKRTLPAIWTVEPTQDGERYFTVRRKGDVQVVELAYHVPSSLHDDSDALGFAAAILADTPNGRLHKQLVESGKAVQVFQIGRAALNPGLQIIGAVVKKDQPLDPVRDALVAAVESFYTTPPTKEEVERVRRDAANAIERTLNDHERIGVGMSEVIALGDWRLLFVGRDKLPAITSEQVADVARRYFRRDNRTVGLFIPEDQPQRADIPAAPTLAEVMKDFKPKQETFVAEAFDPSPDNINRRTEHTKVGGVDLSLLQKKTRGQTVNVAISLHWGDEKSLFGKRTVADMTEAMLARGTTRLTRAQLADEFSKLKMSGSPFVFETTRENLIDAIRLAASVMKEPSFPESEFEQLRNQMISRIEAQRNEPSALAGQAISQHFNRYPKGDWRAAMTLDESLAAIRAVTLDEVKAYHKEFYGASLAEISLVGDFDPAAVKSVVADAFGSWKGAPHKPVLRSYFDIPPARLAIDTPDKESASYLTGMTLPMRDDDPDYPALYVANYIFGGGSGMDSRLMRRVRQKEGLSYGAGSSLSVGALDNASSFFISASAAPQNIARLDAAVREELNATLASGFTANELAQAKSAIVQQATQARSQNGSVARQWNGFVYLNRTFDWSKQFEQHIGALSLEQVNAAFRKYINPARMSAAIASDKSKEKKE